VRPPGALKFAGLGRKDKRKGRQDGGLLSCVSVGQHFAVEGLAKTRRVRAGARADRWRQRPLSSLANHATRGSVCGAD